MEEKGICFTGSTGMATIGKSSGGVPLTSWTALSAKKQLEIANELGASLASLDRLSARFEVPADEILAGVAELMLADAFAEEGAGLFARFTLDESREARSDAYDLPSGPDDFSLALAKEVFVPVGGEGYDVVKEAQVGPPQVELNSTRLSGQGMPSVILSTRLTYVPEVRGENGELTRAHLTAVFTNPNSGAQTPWTFGSLKLFTEGLFEETSEGTVRSTPHQEGDARGLMLHLTPEYSVFIAAKDLEPFLRRLPPS